MPHESKEITEACKRYEAAKTDSAERRADYRRNIQMTYGDQWDPKVRSTRQGNGRPVLSCPVLHTFVQQVTNQARKERPQPKVNPVGEGASQEVADVYEGLFRHVHVASQADVAYDTAVECAGAGGFGYYKFTTVYVDENPDPNSPAAFDQEPRIERILDPLSVYFDPNAMQPDFSDAKWAMERFRMANSEYRQKFGKEPPVDFESDEIAGDWMEEEYTWVANYWYIEETTRTIVMLDNGFSGYKEDVPKGSEDAEVVNSREITECVVHKCIIDGARVLKRTIWPGKWIPIVPVLGREVIVEGRRKFISVIHFALDGQKLLNSCQSGVAEQLQLAARAPWVVAEGSTDHDKRWQDNTQNWSVLTYKAYNTDLNVPNPPPIRNAYEAPIQALTMASMGYADIIKRAVGYVDTVVNPSQADLSGIAVARRAEQSDLTNAHFVDNLIRSQWHGGRILLDLIQKTIDTPRAMRILAPDGTISMRAITMAMDDGAVPQVPGYPPEKHAQIDKGRYDVTISTGPTYNSRMDEEKSLLGQILSADPALMQVYGDIFFKINGWQDLEQRAKLFLPPQVQQAIAAESEGIDPKAQAMLAQAAQKEQMLAMQLQELQKGIQELLFERQAKIVETQGKIQITEMDNASRERIAAGKDATDVIVQDKKHGHETHSAIFKADVDFERGIRELLAKAAMTPNPDLVLASKLAPKGTKERPN